MKTYFLAAETQYHSQQGKSWVCFNRSLSFARTLNSREVAILQCLEKPLTLDLLLDRLSAIGWPNPDHKTISPLLEHLAAEGWIHVLRDLPVAAPTTADSRLIEEIYFPHIGSLSPFLARWELWKAYLHKSNRNPKVTLIHQGSELFQPIERLRILGDSYFQAKAATVLADLGSEAADAYHFFCLRNDGGGNFGVNRNRILLEGAGSRFLVLDDDTWPVLIQPKKRKAPFWISGTDPLRMWKFDEWQILEGKPLTPASRKESWELAPGFDLLKGHEEVLDQVLSVDQILHGLDEPGLQRSKTGSFSYLMRIFETLNPRVGVSCGGYFGSPGIPHRRFLLQSLDSWEGQGFSRDLSQEALDTGSIPDIVRISTGTALFSPLFNGLNYALEGMLELPPFPPLGRDEDGLFGILTTLLAPGSLIGHGPFGLGHKRFQSRKAESNDMGSSPVMVNFIIRSLLLDAPVFGSHFEARCIQAGEYLCQISQLDQKDFQTFLLQRYARFLEGLLAGAHYQYDRISREIPELAATSRKYLETMETQIDNLSILEPVEFASHPETFQPYLGDFGRALKQWPKLYSFFMNQDTV
ncbi:MAG: hypothetical protein KKI09_15060 [Spirochaetes bacterium]|nr:hypothetical protein [Spirochaetota bacterium]